MGNRSTTGRRTAPVLIAGALLLLVARDGLSRADAAPAQKFRFGTLPGTTEFILFVMERERFLQQEGVELEKVRVLNPAPLHTLLVERKVDVGYAGFSAMAVARAQGRDMVVIFGVNSPANVVVVPKASPVRTVADLRGKKIGLFGGPGAMTSAMLFVIGKRWHGIDLQKEAELVTAPGPALAGFLEKGQVDAALVGTTESITFPLTGKYRVLLDIGKEWEARKGRAPAKVTFGPNEAFAREHGEALRAFLRAYVRAVEHVRRNPAIWREYAGQIKVTSEEAIRAMQTRWSEAYLDRWDREQIEVQMDFLQAAVEVLGPRFLRAIPKGLVRTDFVP
ncbi:MAG: ABC transporter substrate-binding protein [Deltaproteobacteria bacterium]|nr:ABC transporter substrate-binding protein [Deltaproteobacteria bacterium]